MQLFLYGSVLNNQFETFSYIHTDNKVYYISVIPWATSGCKYPNSGPAGYYLGLYTKPYDSFTFANYKASNGVTHLEIVTEVNAKLSSNNYWPANCDAWYFGARCAGQSSLTNLFPGSNCDLAAYSRQNGIETFQNMFWTIWVPPVSAFFRDSNITNNTANSTSVSDDSGLGSGAIAGIVVGSVAGALLVAGVVAYCCVRARRLRGTARKQAYAGVQNLGVRL
jgi:hypothetical protein